MEFVILWALSTIGAFTCIMTALVVAWICYVMWRDRRMVQAASEPITYTQGAAYDACQDEPMTDYDTEAVRKLLNSW